MTTKSVTTTNASKRGGNNKTGKGGFGDNPASRNNHGQRKGAKQENVFYAFCGCVLAPLVIMLWVTVMLHMAAFMADAVRHANSSWGIEVVEYGNQES